MLHKKNYLFILILLLLAHTAPAQFMYNFSVLSQPYVPLPDSTSVDTTIWRGDSATFTIDPGFTFLLDTIACTKFYWQGGNVLTTDPARSTISGFNVSETNFMDRGYIDSVHRSPIRAQVTGTPGSRILKVESHNAGFLEEYLKLHTLTDSANVQVWVYEGSNAIEIHYGPSRIRNGIDYFTYGLGPLVFYIQDNVTNGQTQNGPIFILAGNASGPVVQQNKIVNGRLQNIVVPLHGWPADSTVYRFTLRKVGVPGQSLNMLAIYPTCTTDELTIAGANAQALRYTVTTISGARTAISGTLNNSGKVDVHSLSPGSYLLQLQSATSTPSVHRFVKL